jgi:serine/threonine-protein phosphatase PGAM5
MRHFLLTLALLTTALVAVAAEPAPGVRTLYLVRHGFYDPKPGANAKTEMGLNAIGREQAAMAAERLANFPVKFTSLVSSEITRARETADIIGAKLGMPCPRDGRLNETTPPGVGISPNEVNAGAEARLEKAWSHYTTPSVNGDTHELVICHGNVIRWFICRALGVDTQRWSRMDIANCSITMIQVQPDGVTRVQLFNEIAHIPVEKQTWGGKGPKWPLPANQRK